MAKKNWKTIIVTMFCAAALWYFLTYRGKLSTDVPSPLIKNPTGDVKTLILHQEMQMDPGISLKRKLSIAQNLIRMDNHVKTKLLGKDLEFNSTIFYNNKSMTTCIAPSSKKSRKRRKNRDRCKTQNLESAFQAYKKHIQKLSSTKIPFLGISQKFEAPKKVREKRTTRSRKLNGVTCDEIEVSWVQKGQGRIDLTATRSLSHDAHSIKTCLSKEIIFNHSETIKKFVKLFTFGHEIFDDLQISYGLPISLKHQLQSRTSYEAAIKSLAPKSTNTRELIYTLETTHIENTTKPVEFFFANGQVN